jgi:SAM-dependent methyltransferase
MTGPDSRHAGQAGGPWVPEWDGAAYAANTAHHRAFDDGYLATTPLRPGDRVLDLGCGSGDLTATVAELVGDDGHVVGVDAQPTMLEEARRRARPNQSFVCSSVQDLGRTLGPEHDATFDVVLSRATLHWVPPTDVPGVYRSAARLLKPGGWFRVECGGAGNIPKPLALMDDVSASLGGPRCPWNFADPATALDWLELAGLDAVTDPRCFVRCVGQRRQFDTTSLTGWLDSQVLHAYEAWLPEAAHAGFRAAVKARLEELRRADGTFDQTWVRLDLLARRA